MALESWKAGGMEREVEGTYGRHILQRNTSRFRNDEQGEQKC